MDKQSQQENCVAVRIDRGPEYETDALIYRLILPIMWLLAFWVFLKKKIARIFGKGLKTNTFWFDGVSATCRAVKEGATSWRALDILYNYQFGIHGTFADFWAKIVNVQALRNRLRFVRKRLAQAIEFYGSTQKEVKILSVAAGSAQAVLEAMQIAGQKGIEVKALIIDIDPSAIEYSKRLASNMELSGKVILVCAGANSMRKICDRYGFKPNIVEMVGFLDYLSKAKAIRLTRRIYSLLVPGGTFITCNVSSNPEIPFVQEVVNWPMVYRTPQQLGLILQKGGFQIEDIEIIYEPHKVHGIAIAIKTGGP